MNEGRGFEARLTHVVRVGEGEGRVVDGPLPVPPLYGEAHHVRRRHALALVFARQEGGDPRLPQGASDTLQATSCKGDGSACN